MEGCRDETFGGGCLILSAADFAADFLEVLEELFLGGFEIFVGEGAVGGAEGDFEGGGFFV